MSYRFDLLQWRKEQTGKSYDEIADDSDISLNAAWKLIRGKCDPSASTLTKIFEGMGLDPKRALDHDLKASQFWRAVVRAAR
jgi:transcriptional regulator with XRE-family HTH domain